MKFSLICSLFLCISFAFNACYKDPIAVSNYRDQLCGTYMGMQTGTKWNSEDTTSSFHAYSDSLVSHKITSDITNKDALLIDGNRIVYKDLEFSNYYSFSDSIHAYDVDQIQTTGNTIVTKLEFFLDIDSCAISYKLDGGTSGFVNVSVVTKYEFRGAKN